MTHQTSCPLAIDTPRGLAYYVAGSLAEGQPRYEVPTPAPIDPYHAFLAAKEQHAVPSGFEPPPLHRALKPYQRDCVRWGLHLGRAALFEERGLGKTVQQLEWGRHVAAHTGKRVLIGCPLSVAHQTIAQARTLLDLGVTYVRSQADVEAAPTALVIANYDMVLREAFDPATFGGIVLDESSILKHFTSATRTYLTEAFRDTPFKLCCTATPSPNDVVELGNHAEFLNVMSAGDMLTKYFVRDSNNANELRVRGLALNDFWAWVTSWARCVGVPSDIDPSYEDTGYVLPPLHLHEHCIPVDYARQQTVDKTGQRRLIATGRTSATEVWREKRATLADRVALLADLVREHRDEPLVIWHLTNAERDAIQRAIPEVVTVTGSQPLHVKEQRLSDFSAGNIWALSTKPEIAGWGLNWQHVRRCFHVSLDHKFELWYQALGRFHRFGQTNDVHAHLIYAESEADIIASLYTKWQQHREMHAAMLQAMRRGSTHRDSAGAWWTGTKPVDFSAWLRSTGGVN